MSISIDLPSIAQRVEALPWQKLRQTLDIQGFVKIGQLLEPEECQQLIDLYRDRQSFRSRIVMERYRFGQ
jgi:uncharacterized protein